MERKDIILPKKIKKKRVVYKDFVRYFNQISFDKSFDYSSLLECRKGTNGYYKIFDTNKLNKKFHENSYNLLDMMFLFVALYKSPAISVFNFLVSNHEFYGQKRVTKYKIDNSSYNYISKDNDIVKSRQLFVLGVISLFRDYISTFNKSKEKQNINEQLITNLFEDIFSNDKDLIDAFKKLNKVVCSSHRPAKDIMDTILATYVKEIKQINKVKDRILNYYKEFSTDKYIKQKKDRIPNFLNLCDNELARIDMNVSKLDKVDMDTYELSETDMDINELFETDMDIDELFGVNMDINNTKEQNQFCQSLGSAFREVDKMNYQVITSNSELDETDMDVNSMEEQNQFCQSLGSAFREVDKMNYQVITSFSKEMK